MEDENFQALAAMEDAALLVDTTGGEVCNTRPTLASIEAAEPARTQWNLFLLCGIASDRLGRC